MCFVGSLCVLWIRYGFAAKNSESSLPAPVAQRIHLAQLFVCTVVWNQIQLAFASVALSCTLSDDGADDRDSNAWRIGLTTIGRGAIVLR